MLCCQDAKMFLLSKLYIQQSSALSESVFSGHDVVNVTCYLWIFEFVTCIDRLIKAHALSLKLSLKMTSFYEPQSQNKSHHIEVLFA